MRSCVLALVALLLFGGIAGAEAPDLLVEGFRRPPQSAGVRCFWWWLNGNVTKEAIARDLEQMKVHGFSGALIVDAGGAEQRGNRQVPAGPTFLTPAWRELFVHAVREADSQGLELSLNIQSGWNLGGPVVTPEMAAKMLTWSQVTIEGPASFHGQVPQPQTREGYYRDVAVLACPDKGPQSRRPIRDLDAKIASKEVGMSVPDCRFLLTDYPATPGEEDARVADVVDITAHLGPDGQLTWEVPPGKWTVLRFGYTPTSARVSTSSAQWQGRVIDYLDSAVFSQYWDAVVEPLLEDIGPLAGSTLKYVHTDSWECGGANWTPAFVKEFEQRRGYNPVPYLPVIAGRIIESRDVSNRFLADFRKTIGDCIAENHYGTFSELAHQQGLEIHPESGGPHAGPFDALKCLGRSDMPLSEFWVPSPHRPTPRQRFFVKQAAAAAHIYDKAIVGAEAFTSIGPHWDDVLWASQKPSFDHEACSGLNLCFIHTFTCSPQDMGLPGQEYFAGTHFNPNVTWWEMAGGFITYLNRCQHVLRQGRFVADVCHYVGDHVPNLTGLKEADPAHVLPGYDYDVIDEESLLTRLRFEEGRLVLPNGICYRLLSLPDHKVMSVPVLQAVERLVKAGATVIGPKPERTVTLTDYPQCDQQLSQLCDELWGPAPGAAGQRAVGQGRVIWGKAARQVLADDGVGPDFEFESQDGRATLDYIHRVFDGRDVYFVSNQTDREIDADCLFRVEGKRPELWNPLTGDIIRADGFREDNGKTRLPVAFAPYGSWFVVFSTLAFQAARDPGPNEWVELQRLEGPWEVTFVSPWGETFGMTMEVLRDWASYQQDPRIQYHSGKGIYESTFELPAGTCTGEVPLVLDLGRVEDVGVARVFLNGRDLGLVWTKPFRMDIGAAVKAGDNRLKVEVINSWRNRLIGDSKLPADQRRSSTNITVTSRWTLLESGLLGPVRILRGGGM